MVHQEEDPDMCTLVDWLKSGYTPEVHELFLNRCAVKHLWLLKQRLYLRSGLLCYRWDDDSLDRLLLMIPRALVREVLSYSHDIPLSGHLGRDKTISKIKQSFMLYGTVSGCTRYVNSYNVCNLNK
jgi:hypothetical protein